MRTASGLYDCGDGLCGRYDCVECDPSLLCSECRQWIEVCSCDPDGYYAGVNA